MKQALQNIIDPSQASEGLPRPWKRLGALGISITLVVLVCLQVNPAQIWITLKHAHPGWLMAACLAFGCQCLAAATRWHWILCASQMSLHAQQTFKMALIAHGFGFVLLGPLAGDVFKCHLLNKWAGQRLPQLLATTSLDRLFGLLAALCFGSTMILIGWFSGALAFLPEGIHPALAVSCFGLLVTGWLIRPRRHRGTALKTSKQKSAQTFWEALKNNWEGISADRWLALRAMSASMMVHLCLSLVMVWCVQALSPLEHPWWQIMWVFPVISLITSIPITIGGAGLREGASIILLGLYGISPEQAVTAALLTWVIQAAWAMGGISLFLFEKRHWEAQPKPIPDGERSVSIIIPAWNEAGQIHELARHLREQAPDCEWILADGGSHDGTPEQASALGFQVVPSPKGRGKQLDNGLRAAKGDLILLLHVDTQLPSGWKNAMRRCLQDPRVVGGAFFKSFDHPHWLMRGSRLRCLLMMLFTQRAFGDQCLFAKREILLQSGGIPHFPLMEDWGLCRQLSHFGSMVLADACVITSARRFRQRGVIRTYCLMGSLMLQYLMGKPPESLARQYQRDP